MLGLGRRDPQIVDFRPAQKQCIKNLSSSFILGCTILLPGQKSSIMGGLSGPLLPQNLLEKVSVVCPATKRGDEMRKPDIGDLWMWLHLMWLQSEVARGPVGVVGGRFGTGLGPIGPQTGPKTTLEAWVFLHAPGGDGRRNGRHHARKGTTAT